jgi:predicted SprT family Zn-dependent metalloprotease
VVDEAAINKECVEARDSRFGSHDPATQTITLDPKMGPDFMAEVLLHEITHILLYHGGTDEDLEKEQLERICNAVSAGLLDCLRRNPALVKYIADKE